MSQGRGGRKHRRGGGRGPQGAAHVHPQDRGGRGGLCGPI